MKFWFKGENDMMQCVTCSKSSLFVPKLKSIEKIKEKMNILARQKNIS
jgi:ribosomal protein S26